jgi:hypothetical protein
MQAEIQKSPEQSVVVESRIAAGYVLLGTAKSTAAKGNVFLLQKSKHFLAINVLGYDEHFVGKTWSTFEKGQHE